MHLRYRLQIDNLRLLDHAYFARKSTTAKIVKVKPAELRMSSKEILPYKTDTKRSCVPVCSRQDDTEFNERKSIFYP